MSDATTSATAARMDVVSPDGTRLAVWADGTGPALVMVHGAPGDHGTFAPLVQELRSSLTTFAMDRRGSGGSGDKAPFAVEREFEDVAAVVDAVAARRGGPVALWGHSYGANAAMGAAALTTNVRHLVLYEPSLGLLYPPGVLDAMETALDGGDRGAVIRAALVDTGVVTPDQFDAVKTGPRWPEVLAVARTLPREARVEHTWVYRPGQFDRITAATLLLAGSDTDPALAAPTRLAAAAIPHAQERVLHGHGHLGYLTDPALIAAIIRDHMSA